MITITIRPTIFLLCAHERHYSDVVESFVLDWPTDMTISISSLIQIVYGTRESDDIISHCIQMNLNFLSQMHLVSMDVLEEVLWGEQSFKCSARY